MRKDLIAGSRIENIVARDSEMISDDNESACDEKLQNLRNFRWFKARDFAQGPNAVASLGLRGSNSVVVNTTIRAVIEVKLIQVVNKSCSHPLLLLFIDSTTRKRPFSQFHDFTMESDQGVGLVENQNDDLNVEEQMDIDSKAVDEPEHVNVGSFSRCRLIFGAKIIFLRPILLFSRQK